MPVCKSCLIAKDDEEFYWDGRWIKQPCKACKSKAQKAKREADPEYRSNMAAYMRDYRRNNPSYRKSNIARITERRRERKEEQRKQDNA